MLDHLLLDEAFAKRSSLAGKHQRLQTRLARGIQAKSSPFEFPVKESACKLYVPTATVNMDSCLICFAECPKAMYSSTSHSVLRHFIFRALELLSHLPWSLPLSPMPVLRRCEQVGLPGQQTSNLRNEFTSQAVDN